MNEPAPFARRSDVLDQLSRRLESAERLTDELRRALLESDADAIDEATSRLHTVALECKVLHEEYGRFPADGGDDPAFPEARAGFEQVATRLARSAAVGGGLLDRLVQLSRRLIDTLGDAEGGSYQSSGRSREQPIGGLGLRELA